MDLVIDGIKATELAREFGTPLYVYDQSKLEAQLELFQTNFKSTQFETGILYASKAFQTVAMLQLVKQYGFLVDVVSAGELYTALVAGVAPEDIYFHGNNKTPSELEYAFVSKIGTIICDNVMEMEMLSQIAYEKKQAMKIQLRVNVGIEAGAHDYIMTAHDDSKFGMLLETEEFRQCLAILEDHPYLVFDGIHTHIGSQIFGLEAWKHSVDKMVAYLKQFETPLTLNIGGGFGVTYTDADERMPTDLMLQELVRYVEGALDQNNLEIKRLLIEPGRSVVAESGLTLYEIGYQKTTPNQHYVFIDGGMGDNMRPSLYEAKYACDVANKMDAPKTLKATIAGKYCESGDVLIHDTMIPEVEAGDILAVYTTGAYGYSMASQYNKNPIPGVVFVKDGDAKVVVKRQTFEDLIANEIQLAEGGE